MLFTVLSCDKEKEITSQIEIENNELASEYDNLVSLKRSYSNAETLLELTFWAKTEDEILRYLADHTLTVVPVFSDVGIDSANNSEECSEVEAAELDVSDLLIDHELISLDNNAIGYKLEVKAIEYRAKSLASWVYDTRHTSSNDFTKGTVKHISRPYSNDDIEVKWYYLKCALCFWIHGKTESLDGGETSTYVGPTSYKIRARVYYNYWGNYAVTFMQS